MNALAQIGTRQLAGFVWIAVDVDDVVGDLERRADDAAEAAQSLDLLFVGAGERRPEPTGGRDQAGGLLVHHLEVVLDRRRRGPSCPRVSRIWPVTSWAKVSAITRTASGPSRETSREAVANR